MYKDLTYKVSDSILSIGKGGVTMKILKICAEGINIFKDKVEIDFYAEQRVFRDNTEMLTNLFGGIYTNNVLSIVGINASGKTSLLKMISFAMEILNGHSLNNASNKDIISNSENAKFEIYFYDEKIGVCKLSSCIEIDKSINLEKRYIFKEEKLWYKNKSKIISKKDLFSFDDCCLFKIRDNQEEYLQDDVSIAISVTKNNRLFIRDLVSYTNINLLHLIGNFPNELITFLDPSIEFIRYDSKTDEVKLKFYNKEVISIANPLLCEKYLSSGTVKGINVFLNAMMVFSQGGYLIVDELENHFNREIVATLLRFFTNANVNKNGATLIFSTHYSELLDEFDRSDDIYIVRNIGGITVQKLSSILKRNDIKKSEAFKSDYLDGTVPSYDAYINLKEAMMHKKIKEVI